MALQKPVADKLPRDNVQAIIELTPTQEGLLFHYLQAPESTQYHTQLCLELAGSVDQQHFQQAWGHVVQSNEMLRTVFRWQGIQKPVQIVLKQTDLCFNAIDFSHVELSQQHTLLEEMKLADRLQRFNLLEVPLRITLCKLSASRFMVVLSNHHILYDGWSNGILLSEFFHHYQRLQAGKELTRQVKTPFKAYVKWLQSQDQQQQRQFWQEYLKGSHSQSHLPIKKKQPPATSTAICHHVVCPTELKQQLDNFCRNNRVTLSAVLYSAYGIVLQKYTNTDDVLIGTAVSGRTADVADILQMVGLFINTIPLRIRGTKQQSVLEVVQQVNADLLARMEFEATALVNVKSASSLGTWDELFDTIMVIENYPLDRQVLTQGTALAIKNFSITETTNYDLTIVVTLLFDAIEIGFNYRKECCDETAIARLADCFRHVLEVIVNHPSQPLQDVEIIAKLEKDQILHQFNATTIDFPADKTVQALFAEQVEIYADRVALRYGDESLSYRQLEQQSSRLAASLQERGVGVETVVGICAERSIEIMVGIFAILQAGGAYLPLDPRLPVERIRYMLENSGAKIVLCQDKFATFSGSEALILNLGDADLYNSQAGLSPLTSQAHHLAYVLYTSGSTGQPKGVLIEHRSVVNRLHWVQRCHPLNAQDIVLQKTNLLFDVSVWELFGWFFGGASLCLLEPGAEADPRAIVDTIEQYCVTIIHFVPSMLQLFLDCLHQHQRSHQLPSVRRIWASGEALRSKHVAQLDELFSGQNHVELINLYGPTETTVDVSVYVCSERDGHRESVPIGQPIDNIRLYVLNDGYTLQPIGVPGELYISGVGVARGYLNAPELTAQRFVPDPFHPSDRMYKSGDLVSWLPTGELEFLGRVDHQVKIRGFRVELSEVEANVLLFPEVKEAVAAIVKDKSGDDRLVAYVVPRSGAGINQGEIKAFLAEKLPDFMLPDRFVELERMPLTMTGKVDRNKLSQMASMNREPHQPSAMPFNATERVVSEIWAEVLDLERVNPDEVFFEIGGNSLKIIRVCSRLMTALQIDLPVTALFRFPTVRLLARHIAETYLDQAPKLPGSLSQPAEPSPAVASGEVAVIGIAGRFPGARNIDEFWENLKNGVESIQMLSDEELMASGVASQVLQNPRYVRAKGVLDGVEYFDAQFFGYSPKEAEVMDPQIRLLHECVWEALEHGGYNPETYGGSIGLYAGSSSNFHWLQKIAQRSTHHLNEFSLMLLNEKDFLSSRLAYKMNFKGPSVTIQTACSTSLTAIHFAYQELLKGSCDMAVAAGVSVTYPLKSGYIYEEGMIFSPDGHCRAFDAKAEGTVGGNGVGAVVLKRREDAIRDGDTIHAVIKGSAINNDGFAKVGFTAPGVDGQAQVIAAAQASAHVAAESITYIEAHGTATPLGDPIEVEALTLAFRSAKARFCALGSVKSNLGHLDAAAGIAGFIKTVLALKHAQLPPSLHFERPNPMLERDQSPFYVPTTLLDWKRDQTPLRAGVSSFGMGGTNAHLILEEAPAIEPVGQAPDWLILPLSARSAAALQVATTRLTSYLQAHPELGIADVAYTLQVGRKPLAVRKLLICSTIEGAIEALEGVVSSETGEQSLLQVRSSSVEDADRKIVFLFPGQGAQYVNMGAELYQTEPVFRAEMDRGLDLVQHRFGVNLRAILYPQERDSRDLDQINQTEYTQPLLFLYQYALARLLMNWGIRPMALLGHSLGEYVAACLAGVFSLEDALMLVVARARLMQTLPSGSMLSVPLAADELRPMLSEQISIAAVNGESLCVVSGPTEAIELLEQALKLRGCDCHRLVTSHAFHSQMMEPILNDFAEVLARVTFNQPTLPLISNLSGTWVQNDEVTRPDYWVKHLRETVRFSGGLAQLLNAGLDLFVEVGPGRMLTELVRKKIGKEAGVAAINLCRHPLETASDRLYLFHRLGELWLRGVAIDWNALHIGQKRHRVPLPTYAFESQRFWSDDQQEMSARSLVLEEKRRDIADWFYIPSWERSVTPAADPVDAVSQASWMIFATKDAICQRLIRALREQFVKVTIVYVGEQFVQIADNEYVIRPQQIADFRALLERVKVVAGMPNVVVHWWNVGNDALSLSTIGAIMDVGFFALMNLAKALGEVRIPHRLKIFAVTNGIEQVTGLERLCPAKATLYGFTKVSPLEYPQIECRAIDIELAESQQEQLDELVSDLLTEFRSQSAEIIVAYRGGYRWSKTVMPCRLAPSSLTKQRLRDDGVYMITGGLGGIGLAIAAYIAETVTATLVLIGRSSFPERDAWQDWLLTHGREDPTSRKILSILEMEERGARVVVISANIADETQITPVIREIEQRYGLINGVIHAAGVADYAGMMQVRSQEATEAVLAPKVRGTLLLDQILNHTALDFFVLCSSIDNVVYQQKFGQSGYNAANEFLDAYAHYRRNQGQTFWLSINWSDWQEAGMALDSAKRWTEKKAVRVEDMLAGGVTNVEGVEAFKRMLGGRNSQVMVSPQELAQRASQAIERLQTLLAVPQRPGASTRPPDSLVRHLPPTNDLERALSQIWEQHFGVESVGLHQNFFDLGANSFDLVQANSMIQDRFKIELPLVALYEHPTIYTLAKFIRTTIIGEPEANVQTDKRELNKAKSLLKSASAKMTRKNG